MTGEEAIFWMQGWMLFILISFMGWASCCRISPFVGFLASLALVAAILGSVFIWPMIFIFVGKVWTVIFIPLIASAAIYYCRGVSYEAKRLDERIKSFKDE